MICISSIGKKIDAVKATVLPRGALKIHHVRTKRKKTLESDAMDNSNKFCHPAHDDEQQQQAAAAEQQYRNILQNSSYRSTWQAYTNTYSYIVQQCLVQQFSIRSRHSVVKPHTVSTEQKEKQQ